MLEKGIDDLLFPTHKFLVIFQTIKLAFDVNNRAVIQDAIQNNSDNGDVGKTLFHWEKVDSTGSNILADRAYGTEKIRTFITEHEATYTIPPKSNVHNPWSTNWQHYKERHLVECFFRKIKYFRRIATCYDKLDKSFLAFVYLASIAVLVI